jgi:hypothetical protein
MIPIHRNNIQRDNKDRERIVQKGLAEKHQREEKDRK